MNKAKKIINAFIMAMFLLWSYNALADRVETEIVKFQNGIVVGNVDTNVYTNLNFSIVFTNGTSINVPTVASVVYSNNIDRIIYNLYGKLFVANTNNGFIDVTANLSIYTSSNRLGGDVMFRTTNYPVRLYTQYNTNQLSTGSTNILVADPSGFIVNNLLFISGSNEFVRINAIAGTSVILETPTLYGHSISCGVSRVGEYSLRSYDRDNTKRVNSKIDFSSGAQTINAISNVVEVF